MLIVALSTQPAFLMGAAFLQLEADIGLTPTTLGMLTATFFLTASVSSVPLGRLVERIGWRRAMRINAGVAAAILLAIALVGRSVWVLAGLLVVGGIAYGFANPAANKALAERVDPGRRGLIFGLKHAGIPTSTLLAGLALPILVLTIGWPAAFAVAALLAPIVWLLIPGEADTPASIVGVDEPAHGAAPLSVLQTDRARHCGCAGDLVCDFAQHLSGSCCRRDRHQRGGCRRPALRRFAHQHRGPSVSRGDERQISGAGLRRSRGLAWSRCDRVLALRSSSGPWFVGLVLAAFATGWGWPGVMTFTVVNANIATAAASSSITQAGIFLGAGAGPVLLGWTIDRAGFEASWLLVACALALAAAVAGGIGGGIRADERAHQAM